jgi:hypothetical protein
MDTEKINLWIEKFKRAWLGKDFAAIRGLFEHTAEYYETPDAKPFRNIDEILSVWQDIKPLDWRELNVGVRSIDGTDVVMDWSFLCYKPNGGGRLQRKGVYFVKFDDTGTTCLKFVRKVEG